MTKRLRCAVSVGCLLLCLLAWPGVSRVTRAAQSASTQSGIAVPSASPDNLKVVLLGSGMGPRVNLQQFGASTLVEAGSVRLLFDCGRGATLRLTQVGVPVGSISRLFLTHLHSDHVIQIPDLLLTGWAGGGRTVPLEVWGPDGTRDMMDHLQQAFAFDIHMRRDVDDKRPGDGIRVVSHDIKEGVVFATRMKPRLAVYSHAPNTENVMTQTRRTYAGPLQGAEDMLTIEIGEKIDIRHFARPPA